MIPKKNPHFVRLPPTTERIAKANMLFSVVPGARHYAVILGGYFTRDGALWVSPSVAAWINKTLEDGKYPDSLPDINNL